MTGIDPDKILSPITDQKKVQSRQKTDKNEFQNYFQQAIGSATTENSNVESAPFISDIRPVQFDLMAGQSPSTIVDQVARLIDTMESYQRQLNESSATLKDIDPIIEKLARQRDSLSAISQNADVEDELKAIVSQSLSLSTKEVARFKSGHYNDP